MTSLPLINYILDCQFAPFKWAFEFKIIKNSIFQKLLISKCSYFLYTKQNCAKNFAL